MFFGIPFGIPTDYSGEDRSGLWFRIFLICAFPTGFPVTRRIENNSANTSHSIFLTTQKSVPQQKNPSTTTIVNSEKWKVDSGEWRVEN
jgi:hypothetical protein